MNKTTCEHNEISPWATRFQWLVYCWCGVKVDNSLYYWDYTPPGCRFNLCLMFTELNTGEEVILFLNFMYMPCSYWFINLGNSTFSVVVGSCSEQVSPIPNTPINELILHWDAELTFVLCLWSWHGVIWILVLGYGN